LLVQQIGRLMGRSREVGTVPKMYPNFDNAAFLAVLATLGINKLRGSNNAQ
jgi:hypothetical protein